LYGASGASIPLDVVVAHFVRPQLRLLAERLAAEFTEMRFLVQVHRHVRLQHWLLRKSLWTQHALERALPRVLPFVNLNMKINFMFKNFNVMMKFVSSHLKRLLFCEP